MTAAKKKTYRHSTTGMYVERSTPPAGRAWVEQAPTETPKASKAASGDQGASTGASSGEKKD